MSLLTILYMNFKKREIITPNTYQEAMTYVKKIHLSEVQEKIDNKEDFILYIVANHVHTVKNSLPN